MFIFTSIGCIPAGFCIIPGLCCCIPGPGFCIIWFLSISISGYGFTELNSEFHKGVLVHLPSSVLLAVMLQRFPAK